MTLTRKTPHSIVAPMTLDITKSNDDTAIARLTGRLDARGTQEIQDALLDLQKTKTVILDLKEVSYLSSAGVRLFLTLHKALHSRERRLLLCNLQPYCAEVLKISGLSEILNIQSDLETALALVSPTEDSFETPCGRFVFHPGSNDPASVEVLGNIEDVLASRVTENLVRSKKFSSKEYSIGLGGLGASSKEVLPLMGEMMTIGGTMVWLPTDGNDTPDFLVPHQDSDNVVIRTGFNVSLAGRFNEYAEFEAAEGSGATLSEIYRAMFDLARKRRPDYRGAIGLAMRAEMANVHGSGVVRSPVASNAPSNGKWITDSSNFRDWFEFDDVPRLKDVTGLVCGVGLDLDADLSVFDRRQLGATFYINPANKASSREMLHNHGVFFSPQPLGDKPRTLESEIQRVVEYGDFIDMRHLLDKTTVIWGLIGILYIQDFRPDAAGV